MPTVIDGITGVNRITGGADVGGNLDFVANGSRITAPFSDNVTDSNRLMFQTNVPNDFTLVSAIPSGTSDIAAYRACNNSDANNASFVGIQANATNCLIEAGREGAGNFLPLDLLTSGGPRMRIGVNGDFLLKKTVLDFQAAGVQYEFENGTLVATNNNGMGFAVVRTGTDGICTTFFKDAVSVGTISLTGAGTSYNTTSDYRLKENIRAMVAPLERLLRLKPVLFNWKVDGSDGEGFLAHELQKEVPMAVTGEKDGEQMQGVDASKVVPLLVAAVQELTLKVLAFETKLSGGKQA